MLPDPQKPGATRRRFAAGLTGAAFATSSLARQTVTPNPNAIPQNTSVPKDDGLVPEVLPFGHTILYQKRPIVPQLSSFSMTDVQLLPGIYLESQQANLRYLKRLDPDRLLHNFRVNAGLPSSAQPLGGWEKPDCELRGHFVGHYLSACALLYASTADPQVKHNGDYLVAELAKCQAKLPDGYLSAFPLTYFDRLSARQKIWAPFYTLHKIMAGMFDMHQHCSNQQALEVLIGMANWADHWTAQFPEEHMQDILNTEYGGMNEVLYNLAALSGNSQYAIVGDRFTKKKFFNPLAQHRDELRGLHVNTHIPQVIGAARRYELSSDEHFHDVADFFWWEVTEARAYATGGTSNNELWLVEPRRLGAELKKGVDTTECCCAYNMLKLTRHLYQWTADPRYFDYYERTLLNHRIAAIDRSSGATQYYLSIAPAAWKTFNTENDSFWCCTGTGVEEFSKLNDSIYFHTDDTLFVNLFIPSEVHWRAKGIRLRQETDFPHSSLTTLTIQADTPTRATLRIRIPYWVHSDASVKVNGQAIDVTPTPQSYFALSRTWQNGDRVEVNLPMHLHVEAMPDEPQTQAFLYGPVLLAGKLGTTGITQQNTIGHAGPDLKDHPQTVPPLTTNGRPVEEWLKPVAGQSLIFETTASAPITFVPFMQLSGERYSVYWEVA